MSNLENIVSGWYNFLLNELNLLDEETKQIGLKRLEICNGCDTRTSSYCDEEKGGCGCPIGKKVLSPKSECPKSKW
jgi:hypothetical protein